jgi:gamma-glutamyltranspeptidase/glutathione hydrolase
MRGLVIGVAGAATSQPLATSVAVSILARGGTFADAAIAASAVLCVIEPWNSHLGGDAFAIVHEARTGENIALNGSGVSPASATAQSYGGTIPIHGPRATTVPGLVDLWGTLHARWGRLPLTELLAPALAYAKNGFPAGPRLVHKAREGAALLKRLPALGFESNVVPGQRIVQPDLAYTLEAIATSGPRTFYDGALAARICAGSDGHFSPDDLAGHRTQVLPPLAVAYRGLTVHCQPPPSQGVILAQELGLAGGFNLATMSEVDRTHVLVECKKLAFADRNRLLADGTDVSGLLADGFLVERRGQISLDSAGPDDAPPPGAGSDTTYFLVADADGNAVSFIQSIFHNYGAAWMPEGTGVLMNNRLTGFSLDPQSPNFLQPGKRPAHTLNAWLATGTNGKLALVGGTPGAHVQVQTNLQLLVNAVDLGMDPQTAIEAPRWQHLWRDLGQNVGSAPSGPTVLQIENRVGERTLKALRRKGHVVEALKPWAHGSAAQLMQVLPSGAFAFGSDPRVDGHAAAI